MKENATFVNLEKLKNNENCFDNKYNVTWD